MSNHNRVQGYDAPVDQRKVEKIVSALKCTSEQAAAIVRIARVAPKLHENDDINNSLCFNAMFRGSTGEQLSQEDLACKYRLLSMIKPYERTATRVGQVIDGDAARVLSIQVREWVEANGGWITKIGSVKKKYLNVGENQSRFARVIRPTDDLFQYLVPIAHAAIATLGNDNKYVVGSACINWYPDGKHWCPMHTHKKQVQFVISCDGDRDFKLGKKVYTMKSGMGVIFGGSAHGFDPVERADPRLSIAFFCGLIDE